jgi:O-antigen ligase
MLVAAAVILLGWQTLLPSAVKERILMTTEDAEQGQQFDSSAQQRLVLWQDAMDLFKRNPITGTGYDTYSHMGRVGNFRDTHNYYVKVLAETGVAGLLLYLVLLWRMCRAGTKLLYAAQDPFWQGIGLGFVALMASILIMNLFGDRWTYQQVDGFLWILLGCVIRGLATTSEQPARAGSLTVEPVPAEQAGAVAAV